MTRTVFLVPLLALGCSPLPDHIADAGKMVPAPVNLIAEVADPDPGVCVTARWVEPGRTWWTGRHWESTGPTYWLAHRVDGIDDRAWSFEPVTYARWLDVPAGGVFLILDVGPCRAP